MIWQSYGFRRTRLWQSSSIQIGTFDMTPLPDLLKRHTKTRFLVDEAFIGLAGQSPALASGSPSAFHCNCR